MKSRRKRRKCGKRSRKQKWAGAVFLLPSLTGTAVFVLLPFADVLRRSFTAAVTGQFRGLQNYRTIFQNEAFQLAVKNTLKFTGVCIPLLVLTGFCLALLFWKVTDAGLFKALYLFPLAMPTATLVLVWKMVFDQHGFLNLALSYLGEQTGLWEAVYTDYSKGQAAFWVLVGSYLWKNTGYTVVLWLAGISGVSKELLEAARVDGAGSLQRVWYILLPNLKGSLYSIVILSFLNSFKIYREAYLVAGAYPDQSIYLLQHLFNNWFVNLQFDKMAAAAVCTGGFLFLVIILLQRAWDQNER